MKNSKFQAKDQICNLATYIKGGWVGANAVIVSMFQHN